MKKVNIALIGAGTIGSGVLELLKKNGALISERTGVSLRIKWICDADVQVLNNAPDFEGCNKTQDYMDIMKDDEVQVVIELIGGLSPAKDIVLKSIELGKHVVTANKALLSNDWKEIFGKASDNNVIVNFEASVGGAIPIIKSLKDNFVANNLELIYGILNGTTNFVLTMMADHGYVFEKALSLAKEKGIAESDPTLDISGKDSAHKLAILSLLGFDRSVSHEDVYTEGIEDISPVDIKQARDWGYAVKLLAIAKRMKKGLQLRVHPTLISQYHLLSGVKGENNAIFVKGDFMGEALLYGKGAGKKPTASSVMGDIINIAKQVGQKDIPLLAKGNSGELCPLMAIEDLDIPYFVRFSVIDKPGVLAKISSILAENEISIARMSQEERRRGQTVPVIMLTHNANEGRMKKAISEIDKMDIVTDKTVVIRIEG